MTDNANIEPKSRTIATWAEFEKEVWAIRNRTDFSEHIKNFQKEDLDDPRKNMQHRKLMREIKAAMWELDKAYQRGAQSKLENHLRMEQLETLNFHWGPNVLFKPVEEIKKKLSEAKSIKREFVKAKMEEEERKHADRMKHWPEEDENAEADKSGYGKRKYYPQPEEKSQEEKLLARLAAGDLLTEKSLAFSFLRQSQQKEIDLNYRVFWIGDCIAKCIVEEFGIAFKKEWKEAFFMDGATLKGAEEYLAYLKKNDPEEYCKQRPQICISSADFKRLTGQYRIPNRQWHELVMKFAGQTVERTKKLTFAKNGDHWAERFEIDNICRVEGVKTGKLSARTKEPEYFYSFIFDRTASIDFWNSVRLGLFDCRPASYYKLRGGSQLIFRAVGWTGKKSHMELDHLCRVAGIADKNTTKKQKKIEAFLNELKQQNYIPGWKKWKKKKLSMQRKETWYAILKNRNLPIK